MSGKLSVQVKSKQETDDEISPAKIFQLVMSPFDSETSLICRFDAIHDGDDLGRVFWCASDQLHKFQSRAVEAVPVLSLFSGFNNESLAFHQHIFLFLQRDRSKTIQYKIIRMKYAANLFTWLEQQKWRTSTRFIIFRRIFSSVIYTI